MPVFDKITQNLYFVALKAKLLKELMDGQKALKEFSQAM